MAIDTQERRMAAASTARPWMRATFPTGTIDAEERASAGNTYGANPFAAAIVYVAMGDIFLFTSANWAPAPTWYLEATMRATSGTAWARLYDLTDTVEVTDSPISTASATHDRVRSSAVTLTDAHEYEAQFGTTGADSGEARGVGLIGVK